MEKDIEPPTRLLIRLALLFSCVFIFLGATFAAENHDEIKSQKDIISGWFKPSGPGSDNYEYKWYYRYWVNECPICHTPTLAYNPKGVPEAELTCLRCSADFDGVDGWEKQYNPSCRLTAASEPQEDKTVVDASETVTKSRMPTKYLLIKKWQNWHSKKSFRVSSK